MRLLVTGGTGYLGSAVVKALSKKFSVRALVRDSKRLGSLEKERIEIVQGDICDRESLKEAVRGCSAVFHLAALVRTWIPNVSLFEEVNVEGFRNVVEISRNEGVEKLFYTSSFLALEPKDLNPYATSKKKALLLARDYQKKGFPLVILIPTVLYGPGVWTEGNHLSSLLRDLLKGSFPGWFDGGKWRWNFAYVDDVAEGYRLALEKSKMGKEYVLGGEVVSLREFFTLASQIASRPLPDREIPLFLLKSSAFFQECLARLFSRSPSLTLGILETYRHDWLFSDEEAREGLGYTTTPLSEALQTTIQWLRTL